MLTTYVLNYPIEITVQVVIIVQTQEDSRSATSLVCTGDNARFQPLYADTLTNVLMVG